MLSPFSNLFAAAGVSRKLLSHFTLPGKSAPDDGRPDPHCSRALGGAMVPRDVHRVARRCTACSIVLGLASASVPGTARDSDPGQKGAEMSRGDHPAAGVMGPGTIEGE